MQHYRIYAMDRAGHIAQAHDVQCPDDDAARAEAEHEAAPHGAEVWQGARLPPDDGAAS